MNTLIGVPKSPSLALDASIGNAKLMANIDSDKDSMYELKAGDHYIIQYEAGSKPKIVFGCNSRANDPAEFGSNAHVEIGDDSAHNAGESMTVSVLPTGGTDGYFVNQIVAFLNRQISTEEIVVWAENAMIESDYEEKYFDIIADTLHRIGVMNVKSFEIKLSDFLNILLKLDSLPTFGTKVKPQKMNDFAYA